MKSGRAAMRERVLLQDPLGPFNLYLGLGTPVTPFLATDEATLASSVRCSVCYGEA